MRAHVMLSRLYPRRSLIDFTAEVAEAVVVAVVLFPLVVFDVGVRSCDKCREQGVHVSIKLRHTGIECLVAE